MRRLSRLVSLVAGLLLFTSGGAIAQDATPDGDQTAMYPAFTVTATDSGFEGPGEITEGRHLIIFDNQGSVGNGMFFWQLPEGITVEMLGAALPTREPGSTGAAPDVFYESFLPGAPGYAEAGDQTQAIIDFPVGNYVILTEEGAWPTALTVHPGAATPTPVVDPVADQEILLQEFAFDDLPSTFPTGRQVWKVSNIGHQPHQMIVGKVPDGMTFAQVLAGFQPPPQGTPVPGTMSRSDFHAIGGLEIISIGNTAWSILDLNEPGTYAVVCLVPDHETGQLHVAEGMVAVFTVEAAAATPTP
jgi:hypothetical protein